MALWVMLGGAELVPAIDAVPVRGDGEEDQRGEGREENVESHDAAPFLIRPRWLSHHL